MSYKIRDVKPSDFEIITKIYHDAVAYGTASFELEPLQLPEMSERIQALTSKGFPYLVVEQDGVVLGYAYAGSYRPRPAYRWVVENSIYLSEEARGKGFGKILLNALIDECRTKGFRQVIAVIGDSANVGSIAVHKSCGFEMVGTLKDVGWKHGKWLDTVYMQLSLGEGPAELISLPGKMI